jgi:hypothetical protein
MPQLTITATSPANGTAAATGFVKVDNFSAIRVVGVLRGATGDTLDVFLQSSWDNGTTWWDIGHFVQMAAAAAVTTKTVTYAREQQNTTAVAVGSGASPALAANTFLGGDFGGLVRAYFVPGASTSAGAAQAIHILGIDARLRR